MKHQQQSTFFNYQGRAIPLKIYREPRMNIRFSIGKNAVILRMPRQLSRKQQLSQIAQVERWAAFQFEKNPVLKNRFIRPSYQSGQQLQVGDRTYILDISLEDRRTHTAKLNNGLICLRLSKHASEANLQKSTRQLISRVVAGDFHPEIKRRVYELNHLFFKQRIQGVQLKYNTSNWGSCSTKRNINLSTRLLFAPPEVIDYVIIHELAHLQELNHSPRFWKLVEEAMPDYREKEKWLKENGHQCDF